MTAVRVRRLRTLAVLGRFYNQPLSELRQLKQWEVDVLVNDLPKNGGRG